MYVNHENKRGQKFYHAVNCGVMLYNKDISEKVGLKYNNISDDEPRYGNHDIEASYLCVGIWSLLMNGMPLSEKTYSNGWLVYDSGSNNKPMIFHFDIMNNPKKAKGKYSCGLFDGLNEKDLNTLKGIYHSIGNMAPIPWFSVEGKHSINGQVLHKAVDERWDIFLSLLKNNWKSWNKDNPEFTFEEYMKLTGQQIYYQTIFDECVNSNKPIDENTIEEWNNRICPRLKIVDFSNVMSKSVSKEQFLDRIIRTVKVRSEVISILLNKKLNALGKE